MFGSSQDEMFYRSWKQVWEADNWIRDIERSAQYRARRYGIDWKQVYRTTRVEGRTVVWEWYER